MDSARAELGVHLKLPCASNTGFEIHGFWDCYTHPTPQPLSPAIGLASASLNSLTSHHSVTCSLLMDCAQYLPKHCLGKAKTAN